MFDYIQNVVYFVAIYLFGPSSSVHLQSLSVCLLILHILVKPLLKMGTMHIRLTINVPLILKVREIFCSRKIYNGAF